MNDWLRGFIENATNNKYTGIGDQSEKMSGSGNRFLFIIDMQNDFLNGSLAVDGGNDILNPIALEARKINQYKHIIFSKDYHPDEHCSFRNGMPKHCVQGTEGSCINRTFITMLGHQLPKQNNYSVIFKAVHPETESFSAVPFSKAHQYVGDDRCKDNNKEYTGGYYVKKPTGVRYDALEALNFNGKLDFKGEKPNVEKFNLQTLGISTNDVIEICGLAGDFCVKETALGIREFCNDKNLKNIKIIVHHELTRYVYIGGNFVTPYDDITTAYKEYGILYHVPNHIAGKRRTRKNNKKKRSIRKKRNSKSKGKKSRKQRRRTK